MQLSIRNNPALFKVWEKIEILSSYDSNAGVFSARIEDIVDEDIEITKPEILKGEVLLRDNCEVIICLTKRDAIYHFHSTIHKKKSKGIERYILTNLVFGKRVQRREFARIVYSTLIEYTLLTKEYKAEQEWYRSYSRNISGNGILLETTKFVKQDSLLLMKIKLFDELNICLPILAKSCRVFDENGIRLSGVTLIPSNEMNNYKNKIPEKINKNLMNNFNIAAQEKLISFVFNQQIEQRNKGLL